MRIIWFVLYLSAYLYIPELAHLKKNSISGNVSTRGLYGMLCTYIHAWNYDSLSNRIPPLKHHLIIICES